MNSPKLTNALLIALIAINSLFLLGWAASLTHYRHDDRFAMRNQFSGRHHDDFRSFHHSFGASRNFHRGHNGHFRNREDSRWNQNRNADSYSN